MVLRDSLLPRASSLAVQCAVIRITVEYAFEWNMQREPRHRTNKSVRSDGIWAQPDSRVLRLARIFAKYVIYGTVVAYARGCISSTRRANCSNESNVFSLGGSRTPPREFSEPSRDWKALPSPREVNVLFRITRRYTCQETRRIGRKLTWSRVESFALCTLALRERLDFVYSMRGRFQSNVCHDKETFVFTC